MIENAPGHRLAPDADPELLEILRDLGSKALPTEPSEPGQPFFRVHAARLELWFAGDPPQGPLEIDPLRGALERRLRTFDRGNVLARAIGIHNGVRHVVDATAGLGGDGLCLASLGCRVALVERNPALAVLLEVTRRRLLARNESRALGERLSIHAGDAERYLLELEPDAAPEVVYLDPMYPPRRKSALPRREMVLLHAWLGEGSGERELLHAARSVAIRHVVVKRAPGAPPLDPDVLRVYRSKMVRFDVHAPRA